MPHTPITIHTFQPGDARYLVQILHAAARSTAPRYYSAQQVEAWSPIPMPVDQFLTRLTDGRVMLVATEMDDTPLGFIDLEHNGHIDCFYCHPDWIGQGLGTRLYQETIKQALRAWAKMILLSHPRNLRPFSETRP